MPSKYQPQVSCWREDLHKGVYTTQLPLTNNKKLRYANDDYCELSRRFTGMNPFLRIFMVTITLLCNLLSIWGLSWIIPSFMIDTKGNEIVIPCCLLLIFLIYFLFLMASNILFAPEDLPIRLNRKTGKVYVYEHFLLYFGSWATFTRHPLEPKR
jgi:hypothetical protein